MDPSPTIGRHPRNSRTSTSYGFVLLAVTLAISDFTIADAVIPPLVRDLGLTVDDLGLAFTAYFAAAAAFMVLFGRLGDVIGRRRVLLIATGLFIAGSVLSGVAWSLPSFFAGRVLAGLALAATLPSGLGVLNTLYPVPGPQRERAFGWWAAAIGMAAVVGPLIGGAVAATSISWRWAFLGSAVLSVLAGVGIGATLTESRRNRLAHLDVGGALLLATSAGSLALAVDLGGGFDDQAGTAAVLFGVSIAAAAAFAAVQRGRIRRRQETIAPPNLFRYRSFRLATFSSAFMSIGDTGFQLALPLVLGFVLGLGELGVGVVLACYGAGAVLSGPVTSLLARRLDDRTVARYALAALPFLLLGLLPLLSRDIPPLAAVGAVLVAYGVAWGVAYARLVAVSYYEVPEQDSAVAGGVQSALRLLAGALGAGVLTAVFSGVAGRSALDAAIPSHQRVAPSADTHVLATALSAGAQATIAVAAAITAVALIIALRLPEQRVVRS